MKRYVLLNHLLIDFFLVLFSDLRLPGRLQPLLLHPHLLLQQLLKGLLLTADTQLYGSGRGGTRGTDTKLFTTEPHRQVCLPGKHLPVMEDVFFSAAAVFSQSLTITRYQRVIMLLKMSSLNTVFLIFSSGAPRACSKPTLFIQKKGRAPTVLLQMKRKASQCCRHREVNEHFPHPLPHRPPPHNPDLLVALPESVQVGAFAAVGGPK